MAIELKKLDLDDLAADSKAFANENDHFGKLGLVDFYGVLYPDGTDKKPIWFIRHANPGKTRFAGVMEPSDDILGLQKPLHLDDLASSAAASATAVVKDAKSQAADVKAQAADAKVHAASAQAKAVDAKAHDRAFIKQEPDSIDFGGGTPSLLEPIRIREIIKACDDTFGREEDREVTLEANPGTVDRDTLRGFRAMGVNRLSLGAQSFDDSVLRKLGRTHKTEETLRAFEDARAAGFKNISIDLIFGIEGQTMETWEDSLKKALELEPEHISLYSLEFMEGTVFSRRLAEGRMKETDPEEDRCMYEKAAELLTAAGYVHYEISNFAKPGYESRL
ncbi:MAG: coproporphyrinogen III oxidase family protein [Erysipelotrichaceae bacterium]|nr:coproporphyrinogen III oxidase family protein [Erysipelotrichaceae bacterium]